jgi:hypothetical protein
MVLGKRWLHEWMNENDCFWKYETQLQDEIWFFFFASLQNETTFSKVKVSTLRCIEISKVRKPNIKLTKKTMKTMKIWPRNNRTEVTDSQEGDCNSKITVSAYL